MKKRWLVGFAVFALGAALLLPQLAADAHFFLSRQERKITLNPIDGWRTVLSGGKPLQIYLIFAALLALCLLRILLTGSSLKYRSDMQQITPQIATPCAAGQGQYGTARWMRRAQLRDAWTVIPLSKDDETLTAALAAGLKSYEEVEKFAKEHRDAITRAE